LRSSKLVEKIDVDGVRMLLHFDSISPEREREREKKRREKRKRKGTKRSYFVRINREISYRVIRGITRKLLISTKNLLLFWS
jgi:hypothetical protein